MPDPTTISIVRDPADEIANQPPVNWAVDELQRALDARGVSSEQSDALAQPARLTILVAGPATRAAQDILRAAAVSLPDAPEAIALATGSAGGQPVVLAAGTDVRGLVYAVLELADRVNYATGDPVAALQPRHAVVERPSNPIRSIARLFTSDVEDTSWFHDRSFWQQYLTELATQRYNRFNLTLGLGYNFPRHVPDAYFYFAYPFLVDVPGYRVRATNLPDEERDRNLATLQFIGDEVKRRGLHFQLALWTHAYEWIDSPSANHYIEGLNAENHAAYCRDALRLVLEQVPAIDGLTFRIHGESGIPEGSWDFWRAVFDGAAQVARRSGRRLEIDMHAKGIDQETIDAALETGLTVNVSPKYWAEHQGLPYHQASIRPLEHPDGRRLLGIEQGERQSAATAGATPGATAAPASPTRGFMGVSGGSRRHTRYGYTDLLKEDRPYGIVYRIWPGTQRLLLWGDPAMAAGYGRYSNFAGCLGVELCEPLSFKGRMGSGLPGGRDGYADESIRPSGPNADWEKYRYTHRVWGRLTYSPESDPDGWRRYLRREFGAAARDAEEALANASRILLLITTAHHPSASNNRYWPEIYTNMPIVWEERPHPYGDTPSPKRFGTVTSLDPEIFAGVDEFAGEVVDGHRSGKYSPLDVARWLDHFVESATNSLSRWQRATSPSPLVGEGKGVRGISPEARRWAADVAIQAAVGRFFAHKLRAGIAYALYARTGSQESLREAIECYRTARNAWAEAAEHGRVYRQDLTYGREPWLRGHWADRLPAIDQDIADMEALVGQAPAAASAGNRQVPTVASLERERRPEARIEHTPPAAYRPGDAVPVTLAVSGVDSAASPVSATLHYRHVNQADLYQTAEMVGTNGTFQATIPGAYTDSPYPLEYFFRVKDSHGRATHYPPFDDQLANQPYFLLRQAQ
ncbi:MAG: hypothetical protein HY332_12465 [Chloroflexi bacterium]|nr:hypothetical protein [Chloroflexota bacterium]